VSPSAFVQRNYLAVGEIRLTTLAICSANRIGAENTGKSDREPLLSLNTLEVFFEGS
jgi:hypothetical protein